jgi:TldD protein
VDGGTVVDYVAMRENASKLAAWFQKRGGTGKAHGCAATARWSLPREATPNLTIAPGKESVTVEDMIRDVKHGIYLSGSGGASGDFGLMNAYGGGSSAQEIRNGKLAGRLSDLAIQFSVQPFWKGLVAIGGPSSVAIFTAGFPELFQCRTVRSVPARFREVNVINTGRTQ